MTSTPLAWAWSARMNDSRYDVAKPMADVASVIVESDGTVSAYAPTGSVVVAASVSATFTVAPATGAPAPSCTTPDTVALPAMIFGISGTVPMSVGIPLLPWPQPADRI